ncbi:MAG: hypothetical protein IPJ82_05835 [Lewinellaceae bacterium]|nr:hypothetical protein [Lewinellaceae bacterium]
MNAKETLTEWLAEGDLERVVSGLRIVCKKWGDKDLAAAINFQSGRHNDLKNSHLKGLVSHADYSIELAKIRQSLSGMVGNLAEHWTAEGLETVPKTRLSESSATPRQWWQKWEYILATLATIAGVTGYTLKDFFGGNSEKGRPVSLSVFAFDAKKGKQYPVLRQQGHIWLDINGERKQEAIDDKGKAVFQNLHVGDNILLEVNFSEPYHAVRPDSLFAVPENGRIYLPVELKGLDKIAGRLISRDQPLSGVIVSLADVRDTSDALGNYELRIPEALQKKEQQVQFFKPGYNMRIETIHPQTGQSWDFVLEKQ